MQANRDVIVFFLIYGKFSDAWSYISINSDLYLTKPENRTKKYLTIFYTITLSKGIIFAKKC